MYINVRNVERIRLPYTMILIIYLLLKATYVALAGGQGSRVVIFNIQK